MFVSLSTHIAHKALFSRTDRSYESRHSAFAMEALDLKLLKFDVEVSNEVLEDISAFSHQFSCLLISQHFFDIFIRALEVGEQEDENFLRVTGDLNQVDDIIDLMEVSIKHLSTELNTNIIIANIHRRWSLFGNDVDFVRACTVDIFLA